MKTNHNYSSVAISNIGQLINYKDQERLAYKTKLINLIMFARHKLNYEFDMSIVDRINDMDIDELELLNMEYDEQLERYGKKGGNYDL